MNRNHELCSGNMKSENLYTPREIRMFAIYVDPEFVFVTTNYIAAVFSNLIDM